MNHLTDSKNTLPFHSYCFCVTLSSRYPIFSKRARARIQNYQSEDFDMSSKPLELRRDE
ncbi:hypothetical protein AUEXF2481DRAFT_475827 [Aureobasidium subglaciale EXF-2481]|uniref:Uncharacterized protein n=1 Tax=Aureobasidium subglaciale (strain EXF-2481) TaxID=1043005 RepID=A0A074YVS8_AURSE|nr:uncharacterized protein AUEXF2481DRAFT_475827 [Aureobasidium subglaciale EXF-2481]KEQ98267.1 hypothetical protein AUEXF2481DRAFT_475827 [Aureobasidium subglaciale EXF-2481]